MNINSIETEFNRIMAECSLELEYAPLEEYSKTVAPDVINILYNGKENEYIKDYYENMPALGASWSILQEIFSAKYTKYNIDIASKIQGFLGDEIKSSLTLSYGFGGYLNQFFPQDPEYIDKVFIPNKKNVIIGFEPNNSASTVAGITGAPMGNIFNINSNTNDKQHYKSRLKDLISRVFTVKPSDITIEKLDNKCIYFNFTAKGNSYMIVWIRGIFSIPSFCMYYSNIYNKATTKIAICSTSRACGKDYNKYLFFRNEFSTMIQNAYPTDISNTALFKNQTSLKSSVVRYTRNGVTKNLWNGFGGKKRTRRYRKQASRRKL